MSTPAQRLQEAADAGEFSAAVETDLRRVLGRAEIVEKVLLDLTDAVEQLDDGLVSDALDRAREVRASVRPQS